MDERDELLDEDEIETADVELDELVDDDETPGVPTEFDRSVTWIHRIFARDIDPNDQFRILLRFLMVVAAAWYLGRGLYGVFIA